MFPGYLIMFAPFCTWDPTAWMGQLSIRQNGVYLNELVLVITNQQTPQKHPVGPYNRSKWSYKL